VFAIVDLESTGGKPADDRIMEIAIVLHDGQKIVDQYESLINPERDIQEFVQRLTGIKGSMVDAAPKFSVLAQEIDSLTHDCIFVAHNVGFDYRMVQSAFKRHKMSYKRPTLCTVKLSQALMPSSEKYNLDHLCKSLNIDNTSRHRAMGDCKATAELLHLLIESHGIDTVMDHVEGGVRA
jgi:DNA polymerase-3 subunit epsilon